MEWGTPFCFPQFGKGGERAGTPPSENPLPIDGFAKSLKWTIQHTGRAGTFFHHVILQSKHGSIDDSQYGPRNQSDTPRE
jgi:D-hexose-6-phosphate mutarotase